MKQRWPRTLAIATVAALLGRAAAAADPPPGEVESQRGPSRLERTHEYVSLTLEELSRKIDAFFGGDLALEESTGTYLKTSLIAVAHQGGNHELEPRLTFRLSLPQTEGRLRLVLLPDPREGEPQDEADGSENLAETTGGGNYSAALEVARQTPSWTLSAGGGVRIEWPPDPFVRVRARRSIELTEAWLLRLTQRVGWFVSVRLESTSTAEFERPISDKHLFRAATEAAWREEDFRNVGWHLSEGLLYYQRMGSDDALSYRVGLAAETQPHTRTAAYDAAVGYRRRIYRKWVFLSLEPALTWERSNAFRPDPSFTVRLEGIFGDDYL